MPSLAATGVAALGLFLLQPHFTLASPFSQVASSLDSSNTQDYTPNNATADIEKRCANPCGYYGQLCCNVGQTCYTDSNNEAQCGGAQAATTAHPAGGYWALYTSTWVETNLVTKTAVYSSYVGGAATPTAPWYAGSATPGATAAPLTCPASQISCGNICCATGQYCVVSGQCGTVASSVTASAPLRPTASTLVVQTATLPTTTTVPFIPPQPTGAMQSAGVTQSSQSGGGLSGGAIAGIVIGVLLAVIILALLCICLCFRELWHGFLALIGARRKPVRRRETVEYSSHHYGSNRNSRRWYGAGGDRPSRIERSPKRGSGAAKWALGLGALAAGLGLKRKIDRRHEEKSDYSSTDSYTGSYTDTTHSE